MSNAWVNKRVFLTGHTGFKGSWLTLWLHKMGAHVRGYSLEPPTNPSLFELARVSQFCDHQIGDVRDAAAVAEAMRSFGPEVVIHMAAQPIVRLSYEDPILTYSTNVMGTVNVLQAARSCSELCAIVNVTSDKCYENREWVWGYRESDAFGGHDPYSSSKGAAEIVASAFQRSYFNGQKGPFLASARAGNVIGGGDWARDRLVPDMVRAFTAGEAVNIRRPHSVRPWQHVLEPLSGYLALAQRLLEGDASVAGGWNFGPTPDAVQPVGRMADQVVKLWGDGSSWVDCSNPNDPHEANLLQLDSTKARVQLGWKSRWNFEETLKNTVDWYRGAKSRDGARNLCLSQIESYQVEC